MFLTLSVLPHLRSQIGDANELLEDVLGQDVSVASLLDVIRRHIDVIGAQVKVSSRDGPDGSEE